MTTRRAALAGLAALPLAACGREAASQPSPASTLPLREAATFPVGTCVQAAQLRDPAFAALVREQFSQLTPEWELKMEYVLQADGSFRFDAPDAIAAFARTNGLRLHGHALVWYAQEPPAFQRLEGNRTAFGRAYANYIQAVAGRYAGAATSWDVVNEPVRDDGEGLREHLWSRNLGQLEHMVQAFQLCAEAAPRAARALNDYNLEYSPAKRRTFLRLAEDLLKAGAPLQVLGTQTHLAADIDPAKLRTAIADLASLGLPIHVSELDISLNRADNKLLPRGELARRQPRVAAAVAEAFLALPERQRFAFTLWGVRDADSWLRTSPEGKGPAPDTPLAFDDEGRPKPMAGALAQGLAGG